MIIVGYNTIIKYNWYIPIGTRYNFIDIGYRLSNVIKRHWKKIEKTIKSLVWCMQHYIIWRSYKSPVGILHQLDTYTYEKNDNVCVCVHIRKRPCVRLIYDVGSVSYGHVVKASPHDVTRQTKNKKRWWRPGTVQIGTLKNKTKNSFFIFTTILY